MTRTRSGPTSTVPNSTKAKPRKKAATSPAPRAEDAVASEARVADGVERARVAEARVAALEAQAVAEHSRLLDAEARAATAEAQSLAKDARAKDAETRAEAAEARRAALEAETRQPAPPPAEQHDAPRLVAIEAALTAAQGEIDRQRESIARLTKERVDLQATIKTLKDKNGAAPAPALDPLHIVERNALQSERDALAATLASERAEFAETASQLRRELDGLRPTLTATKDEVSRLRDERDLLAHRLARLRTGAPASVPSPYTPEDASVVTFDSTAAELDASLDEAEAFPTKRNRRRILGIILVTGGVLLFVTLVLVSTQL